MTATDKVLVSNPGDGVRVLTLNCPERHNAIDMAMAERLLNLLDAAETDATLRCLILTGAGDKAFCAGFDIHEMAGFDAAAMRDAFVKRDPLMLRIAQHRLPVIAALNGLAYGAGALIAAASDLRVASESARFKVTAINYGSANATWSLPPLVGTGRAKDLLLTGRAVGGEEALRIGLFDRLVPDGEVMSFALALAEEIAAKPPEGVQAAKHLIDSSLAVSPQEAWLAEYEHVLAGLESDGKGGKGIFEAFLGNEGR
jgi:enoyl-CoA hydratase/carnithine racemase